MLHLTKLAVGIRDIAHLRQAQAERLVAQSRLFHRTRNLPRRGNEIVAGGSMYWVIGGATIVRQRVIEIEPGHWDDGSACAVLGLDPELVPVEGRPTRAFQGWRYLDATAAPLDLGAWRPADGESDLPSRLRQELRALCLL